MSLTEQAPQDGSPQPPSQSASNAVNHTNLVQMFVRKADKEAEESRSLIDLFRQQLQLMKAKVENSQQEILSNLKSAIQNCNSQLVIMQLQQKEDNISFQNQITELKKEKSIISQMISTSNKHTQDLIDQVGGY